MKYYCTIALLLIASLASAQTLLYDSTFGNNGKVFLNTGIGYLYIRDAAAQASGKTVVLANASTNGVPFIALAQYNPDGSIDSSFSGDGIADSTFINENCRATAVRIQADGKMVAVGYKNSAPEASFIIRYNADGSFDASFGNSGIRFLPASISYVYDLLILPTGKLRLLSNPPATGNRAAFTQLNSNGSTDSAYAAYGTYVLPVGDNVSATNMYPQPDGKFLLFGNNAILRINPNGGLDYSFGTSGSISLSGGLSSNDAVMDIALQPDGKIVARGKALYNTSIYTHLVRFNANGTPDNTFGTNGERYIYFSTTGFVSGSYPTTDEEQMSVQTDGKILIAGYLKNSAGNYDMAVVRLTADGAFDNTFDADGIATAPANQYGSYGLIALQQANGNITVVGFGRSYDQMGITVAGLTATGQSNTAMHGFASLGTDLNGEEGRNVLVQSDQKIVTVKRRSNGVFTELSVDRFTTNGGNDYPYGRFGTSNIDLPGIPDGIFSGLLSNNKLMLSAPLSDFGTQTVTLVVRLNTTGSLDSSFGTNGKLLLSPANSNITIYPIHAAFQPDGKSVLLVRQLAAYIPDSVFLIRLNANGSYDNTFNGNGRRYLSPANGNNYTRVCLQPDNKILLADNRYNNYSNGPHTFVQRLNTDGTTDNTFNGGTAREVTFAATNVVLQPDGKLLAAGSDITTAKIARLNSGGTLDATFGTSGVASLALSVYSLTNITSIATATDGKILFKAHTYAPQLGGPVVQLTQLKTNGQYDSTFGTNGSAVVSNVYSGDFSGQTMALQADNKVLITGFAYNTYNSASGVTVRVKRENAAGRLYTFTGSGLWSNPANWSDSTVPPANIPTGSNVIINPPATGECVINTVVHVLAGANITVTSGKKLRLQGGLIIQ